jgi:hypothetical protein
VKNSNHYLLRADYRGAYRAALRELKEDTDSPALKYNAVSLGLDYFTTYRPTGYGQHRYRLGI